MLRYVRLLRTPIDELVVTGSRWSRLYAKSVQTHNSAIPSPFITLIPTLHIASVQFYDKVIDYMVQAVQTRENVVILLEGICDNEESEVQQMEEYFAIARNPELRASMLEKADKNTLYNNETIHAMCEELAVSYKSLEQPQYHNIRLQECYLKPKMAALVGAYLRNDADLNMKEVEAILLEETGPSESTIIPIHQLGAQPAVRHARELKVAKAAQRRCIEWQQRNCEGEVILPWGFYHAEGIKHEILAMNAKEGNDGVVFVESDETVCRVPFGISKELLM